MANINITIVAVLAAAMAVAVAAASQMELQRVGGWSGSITMSQAAELTNVHDPNAKVLVKVRNMCRRKLWMGVYPDIRVPKELPPGRLISMHIMSWQTDTYIWGRTDCSNNGTCVTGNCGSGYRFNCYYGNPQSPPISSAFFRKFKYTVDLSSGFNVPISVTPNVVAAGHSQQHSTSAQRNCAASGYMGCPHDVNAWCPYDMRVHVDGRVVACAPHQHPQSMEKYYRVLMRVCPCVHPISDARYTTPSTISDGYTVTFCPPDNSS